VFGLVGLALLPAQLLLRVFLWKPLLVSCIVVSFGAGLVTAARLEDAARRTAEARAPRAPAAAAVRATGAKL
jgi:hypothetical protein